MQIYNFDKNRKRVKKEKNIRLVENEKKSLQNSYEKKVIHINKEDLYEFDLEENCFIIVNNKVLGVENLKSNSIYKLVANKKVNNNKFISCEFNNIKFENCTFYGTSFENCIFHKIVFSNCNFYDSRESISIFEKNCVFENCTFNNTDLKKIVVNNSSFDKVKFIFSNLNKSIFDNCNMNRILISDCNLKALKIIETNIKTLEFEDKYLSKVDENTFIDKVKITPNSNYDNLFKIYKSISAIYESNRLSPYAGEYYYLAKIMERKSLSGIEKVKSNLYWGICGYGERPTFALITSFEIVLVFAIIYMFCGLCINGSIINYSVNIFSLLDTRAIYVDFIRSFYFSLVTFTSVGYGDIFPTGYSVVFSCLEMILGVTMVGVWTATLARKISR